MENNDYKIREVAGSPVITIPRRLLRELMWRVGDEVRLSIQSRDRGIRRWVTVELIQRAPKPNGKGKRG